MLDYENQRKLIIVFILAAVLVIIFAIVALVLIWMPKAEKEKVYEVGVVENVSIDNNAMLLQHYDTISNLLMNEKIEEICDLVGEDYLEYYEYTLDDIKTYIQEENVMGKRLELVNSTIYSMSGYSNVFYLDIKVEGEVYSVGVVIRETSPENYTIAFDKFIDYKTNVYTGTINSVQLNVQKLVRFTNNVEYRVRVTNNYDKSIILNSNNDVNGIILTTSQGDLKNPIMTSLSSQGVEIQPQYSQEFEANYNVESDLDYMAYNVLVLKGVQYSGIQGTNNLEYYL